MEPAGEPARGSERLGIPDHAQEAGDPVRRVHPSQREGRETGAARIRDVHVVGHRSVRQAVVRKCAAEEILPSQQLLDEPIGKVVLADLVSTEDEGGVPVRPVGLNGAQWSVEPPVRGEQVAPNEAAHRVRSLDLADQPERPRRPVILEPRRRIPQRAVGTHAREQPVGSAPPRRQVPTDPLGVVRGPEPVRASQRRQACVSSPPAPSLGRCAHDRTPSPARASSTMSNTVREGR